MKVSILGAGLSGVSLAYFLKSKGMKNVSIVEKSSTPSGLLRSKTVDEYTFDIGGSHIIFSKNKEILNFMVSLLGRNVRKNKRNTKILYKGRLVKYPFENGLHQLPLKDNLECLASFLWNRVTRSKEKPDNMGDWFYYLFGRGISDKYLIPYNQKIWKFPPEKMSTVWVERIPNPPVIDIIKSSIGIPTEGYTHQLYFYYPLTGGIQSLIEALIKKAKLDTTAEFEVKSIEKEKNFWIISDKDGEIVEAQRVISTIPLPQLVNALKDTPREVRKASRKLMYNSLITIGIGLNKKQDHNISWLYIPDQDILTHRVSFPSNFSPKVAPRGSSSLLAEITVAKNGRLLKKKDNEIAEKVIEDLSQIGILDDRHIETTLVSKFEYAYVVYDKNYKNNLDIILNWIKSTGIITTGRFGLWEYANMDKIIEMSKNLVNQLIK